MRGEGKERSGIKEERKCMKEREWLGRRSGQSIEEKGGKENRNGEKRKWVRKVEEREYEGTEEEKKGGGEERKEKKRGEKTEEERKEKRR